MIRPTAVEPVNVTARTSGAPIRCSETRGGSPNTRLTAPAGRPASASARTTSAAVRGVSSAALRTTVQPAASAAPSFRAASTAGKFQAVNAATTPSGAGADSRCAPGARPWMIRPSIRPASSPFHCNVSTARPTSPAASAGSLPPSTASAPATSPRALLKQRGSPLQDRCRGRARASPPTRGTRAAPRPAPRRGRQRLRARPSRPGVRWRGRRRRAGRLRRRATRRRSAGARQRT